MGIVRENINFERGMEPKQSMDLGLVAKWMSIKKDDILEIKRDFTTNSQNEIDDDSRYNIFKEGNFFGVEMSAQKYDDGCIGFTGYTDDGVVRSSDDIFIWGTPLQIDQRFEIIHQGIQESINFERGIDPKDSMKIGRVGEREIRKALNRLVEIRGGSYEIWDSKEFTEGKYFMDPAYKNTFRADNFFIRYYPELGSSVDHFAFGYRIAGRVMKEKILTTAEEGLTEILKCITPLPHG
jgi:hypothetical protein